MTPESRQGVVAVRSLGYVILVDSSPNSVCIASLQDSEELLLMPSELNI